MNNDGAQIFAIHSSSRMTAEEFDQRWQEILHTYGTTTREAVAKRDREIALLLAGSGWTQQEIASRIGRKQTWVSEQIVFGGFLALSRRDNDDLTENRFNKFWRQTQHIDNTPDRYDEVARLLEEEAGRPSQRSLHGQQIIEKYGDASWHRADKMAEALEITEQELTAAMAYLRRPQGAWRAKGEEKLVGRGRMYRIFRKVNPVSPDEISTKLGPLIEELKIEGKKTVVHATLANVLRLAQMIERQIDDWSK